MQTERDGQPLLLILAADLVEACLQRYELEGTVIATALGAKLDGMRFKHPLHSRRPVLRPPVAGLPGRLRDARHRHRHRPLARRPTASRTSTRAARYGMKDDEILTPVMGDGRFASSLPLFGGLTIWEANPKIVDAAARQPARCSKLKMFDHSYMHCWRHKTPIIYRATTQWFAGMDEAPGYDGEPPSPARDRAARHRGDRSSSRPGARRACTA